MKKITLISALALMFAGVEANAQSVETVLDPNGAGGFELGATFEDNGWGVNNSTYGSRKWQIGTGQPGYTGERGAFIGANETTVGTNSGSRICHIYHTINIPAGAENPTVTFKYKQEVVVIDPETGPNDYIYLSILDAAPATGSTPSSSQFTEHIPQTGPLADFTEMSFALPEEVIGAGDKIFVITFRSTNLNDPATIGWGAVDDVAITYEVPCSVDAPTAAAQDFCNAGTVADLEASMSGTGSIVWYDAATGGTMLADTDVLTAGSYFAAVVDGTCESDRTEVAVTINNVAAPTGDAAQTIEGETAADVTIEDIVVTADGTVIWYASEADAMANVNPLSSDTQLTDGATYYATQTVGDCTSTTAFAVTVTVSTMGVGGFDGSGFAVYPNPVHDVLYLTAQNPITSVSILNSLGQELTTAEPNTAEVALPTASLAAGTYYVQITTGESVTTVKIIK